MEPIRFYRMLKNSLSFCTKNLDFLDTFRSKYQFLDIEEDKHYKIGSIKNDKNVIMHVRDAYYKDFKDEKSGVYNLENAWGKRLGEVRLQRRITMPFSEYEIWEDYF